MQENPMDNRFTDLISGEDEFNDPLGLRVLQHLYSAAVMQLRIKFDILNSEFRVHFDRSPIHHIESRLKSPISMAGKLRKRGYEVSIASAKANLNDIAGIRVVCCYIDDVYKIEEMFLRQSDVRLLERMDYIKEPKENGYRSLHLDVEIPVYLSSRTEYAAAEIQLRTVAMDFWASLEHDLKYKSDKIIPESIKSEMQKCSDEIAGIDRRMQEIYKQIQKL